MKSAIMRVSMVTAPLLLFVGASIQPAAAFSSGRTGWSIERSRVAALSVVRPDFRLNDMENENESARRRFLRNASVVSGLLVAPLVSAPENSNAAVGTLPEFSDTNAILQGLTINVADQSQQDSMIAFLKDAFDFEVLRQRKAGSVTETWLGYGPEQLSIPSDFTFPVSSFRKYGGHASMCIRYDTQSQSVLYRTGSPAPGDNIEYLQVGVLSYRVSQMTKNGGNVLDAYGYINVVSPSGLPMRGIVGIRPDPMMFVAINCADVEASRSFYERLGFVQQEYPYARPSKGTGQFEPPQPPKSVYMAPSPNSMGVLLLQNKNKRKSVTPNPVLQSLNIVYTPSREGGSSEQMVVEDPSGVAVSFQSVDVFESQERATRVTRGQ